MILIYNGPLEMEKWTKEQAKMKSAQEILQRKKDLRDQMYYKDDVDRVMAAYPKVNFRFQISPTKNLPTSFIPIFSTLEETEYL